MGPPTGKRRRRLRRNESIPPHLLELVRALSIKVRAPARRGNRYTGRKITDAAYKQLVDIQIFLMLKEVEENLLMPMEAAQVVAVETNEDPRNVLHRFYCHATKAERKLADAGRTLWRRRWRLIYPRLGDYRAFMNVCAKVGSFEGKNARVIFKQYLTSRWVEDYQRAEVRWYFPNIGK